MNEYMVTFTRNGETICEWLVVEYTKDRARSEAIKEAYRDGQDIWGCDIFVSGGAPSVAVEQDYWAA